MGINIHKKTNFAHRLQNKKLYKNILEMKKIIIFLFVLFAFANLQAQDYEISFAATGVTTNLETVFVENLTQGTSVTVQGSDILHLVGTSQIEELDNDNLIHIYPNPLTSSSKIEFKIPYNAPVTLTLLDAAGKSIISIQKELEAGTHLFEISDLKSGFYTIKIASPKFVYSEPIISHSKSNGPVSISYLTSCNDNEGASYLKSLESVITMQYTTGDNLRFTGHSGNYTAIVTDIPTQSKTITFNFTTFASLTSTTATNITTTSATAGGNITSEGGDAVTVCGVCWSTSPNPTIANSKTTDSYTTGSFTSSITGLTENTTYYMRAYATNAVGTSYGNEITFTTQQSVIAQLPTVTTTAATNIVSTIATSGGNITSNGGATVTVSGVCWSTSTTPTITNSKTTDGSTIGSYSSSITGLTANTTYYVRAYATNSVGTAYGNQITFTTNAVLTMPSLTTTTVTDIGTTYASSGGIIVSNGGVAITASGICWSTTTLPTTANSKTNVGATSGTFLSSISGLTANTTYYVRAYATNTIGTAYGNQVSFTTTAAATVPTLTTIKSSDIQTTTATINGEITSNGGATITVSGVCWSTSSLPTILNSKTTDGTSTGLYSSLLTGLTANTMYYARAYATNSVGTAYGAEVVFTTNPVFTLPTLITYTADNIGGTTASSGGEISSNGGTPITASGICWSTSTSPTTSNSKTSQGFTIGAFGSTLTGLTANTTYYVRAYATNSVGTAYGNQISFTTNAANSIPTITTTAASSIAQTTAISGGTISTNGGATITASGICWSTSASPTTSDSKTTYGIFSGSFSSTLTGLTANTTYYVRAYATNSVGTAYGNQISFTTLAQVTTGICDAIDNCNTTITSSGVLPWLSQSTTTHDGVDAAESGDITSSESSAMQTTIVGPVDISFWWKVSSEATYDYLSFYIDGVLQEKISGEVNWTQKSYYLAAGTHILKWEYSKDNSSAAGSDCGWVDQLTVTPSTNTVPTISATTTVSSIASLSAVSGGTISSNGGATITASGVCWSTIASPTITDGKSTDGSATGTFTSNLAGLTANTTYYVRAYATNAVGTAYGPEVSFTTLTATVTPLCDAIDFCDRTITTTGNASWAIQAVNTHDATDAAQSGLITHSQSSTMETTIVGPVDISFWWRVSSESTYDYLTFYINGVYQTAISGTPSWAQLSYFLPAGTNTIKWVYAKDNTTSSGSDCGWVDQLTVTTSTKTIPTITTAEVTTITQTTATSVGTIVANGGATITTSGVCWSTTPNPTITSTKMSGSTATGSITFNLTGLTANTTYYLRAFATNAAGTAYGNEVSFTTTQLQIPTLTTKAMIFVFDDSAVSGADIQSNGGAAITASGVCWSTSPNPTTANSKTVDVPSNNTFNSTITGLTASTTYYIRAYATNSVGTAYGNEISFTTILITLPTVTTTAITSIAASTAVSGGTIVSKGGGTITASGVCWSTTPNPTIANSKNDIGYVSDSYSSTLTSLSATTTYYVRAYATNSKGTAYGNEVSFVSAALPTTGLCDAIDYCTVAINSTGTTPWALQTTTTHDGVDAAKTGVIGSSQSTTMTATIVGPVDISFWWKVSSESGYDILTFYINNVVQTNFSGEYDWEQKNYNLPAGTNTIKWEYKKDNTTTYGSDCAWVDQLVVSAAATAVPTITTTAITGILENGASSGGNITDNGGGTVIASGICYGTTAIPTTSNLKVNTTETIGPFTSVIQGLTPNTTYYVRAFAINSLGTGYGDVVSFTTTAPVPIPICNAVDNCSNTITTSGNADWQGFLTINRDGIDAARSGSITHSQSSTMETSIVGPIDLSFWWKVSSEATYDGLSFYIDGVLQEKISGEVNWTQKNYFVPAGSHIIKWTYSKDNSTTNGSDYGWVDLLIVTPSTKTLATITTTVASTITGTSANTGGNISSNGGGTITASGLCYSTTATPTIANSIISTTVTSGSYIIAMSSLTPNTTYYARAYATNIVGTAYGNEITFTTPNVSGNGLCEAVDNCNLTITTYGTANWTLQNVTSYDLVDAAKSGTITHNQSSSMETTIVGPVDLSFWWKVSSETNYDLLRFYINGIVQFTISGTTVWENKNVYIPSGTNTIKWDYSKDNSTSVGSDCGWVDNITYTPSTLGLPTVSTITTYSIGQNTAESGVTVTADGGSAVTKKGLCWSLNTQPTTSDNTSSFTTGTGTSYHTLIGLNPNSTYYYRAYATNSVGTAYGEEFSFTTLPLELPIISALNKFSVSSTTVISNYTINSNGGESLTQQGLCWSTSPTPTILDNKLNNTRIAITSYTTKISALLPNTTYYMRAYATNSLGTVYSSEITFTTDAATGSVTDASGNIYETVVLGTQEWMTENLRTTKFNDGTNIPLVSNSSSWTALTTPAYSEIGNSDLNSNVFGKLYNGYSVRSTTNGGKNICPTGWHIPTTSDWNTFQNYLITNGYNYDGSTTGNYIAKSLAATWGWTGTGSTGAINNTMTTNNTSDFSALPTGYKHGGDGTFYDTGSYTLWWVDGPQGTDTNYVRFLKSANSDLTTDFFTIKNGFSVRCIKN